MFHQRNFLEKSNKTNFYRNLSNTKDEIKKYSLNINNESTMKNSCDEKDISKLCNLDTSKITNYNNINRRNYIDNNNYISCKIDLTGKISKPENKIFQCNKSRKNIYKDNALQNMTFFMNKNILELN